MSLTAVEARVGAPETAPAGCRDPDVGMLLVAYEARRLWDDERNRFEEHLLLCRACSDELEGSEAVLAAIHAGSVPSARKVRFRARWVALAAGVLVAVAGGWAWLRHREDAELRAMLLAAARTEAPGNFAEAEAAYRSSLEVRRSKSALSGLGNCAWGQGRHGEAERWFREALAEPLRDIDLDDINDAGIAGSLAHMLIEQDRDAEAADVVARWLSGGGMEKAWNRADLYSALARRRFEQGARADGDRYLALAGEANADVQRLQPDAAEPRHESLQYRQLMLWKAVELDGDFAAGLSEAERILRLKQVYDAYQRRRGEAAGDQTADGMNFVGVAKLLLARDPAGASRRDALLAEAHAALTGSRQLREQSMHPKSRIGIVWALENLGLVALERGDVGEAVARMEEARTVLDRIAPGDATARDRGELLVNLGTGYAAAGRSVEAAKAYAAALSLDAGRSVAVAALLGEYRLRLTNDATAVEPLAAELRAALAAGLPRRLARQIEEGLGATAGELAALPRLVILPDRG